MSILQNTSEPEERELVVAFFDLSHFARFARSRSPRDEFDFLSRYYEFVGDIVEHDEGIVVKFMGDAGLIVYPGDRADAAVLNLRELKRQGDDWLKEIGAHCNHVIKAHIGPVICGPVGTTREKRFDVFGDTVETTAKLQCDGFQVTQELLQRLSPETRELLK